MLKFHIRQIEVIDIHLRFDELVLLKSDDVKHIFLHKVGYLHQLERQIDYIFYHILQLGDEHVGDIGVL